LYVVALIDANLKGYFDGDNNDDAGEEKLSCQEGD